MVSVDVKHHIYLLENSELTNVLPLKPGAGQNITTHASPTARNFFLVLISTFQPFPTPFFFFLRIFTLLFNFVGLPVWAPNKIDHPARGHKRFKKVPGGE